MGKSMQQENISEKLLRLAVHASPSGILIVGGDGCIAFANQALLGMFGYSSDELLGHPIEILVPDEDAEDHRRHRRTFGANPSPRNMGRREHFNGVSKDGRIFPVEIGLRPCETEEGGLVVATVIDITERKLIEDRLRRHEESLEDLVAERTRELHEAQLEKERVLEQLIQSEKLTAIGTLVSGIGHEINNPLYLILSMAEAIRDEEEISSCREYGEEIVKHCRHIAETVKNLSQYARPSGNHNLEKVDLNESVSAAVVAVKRSLQSDNIEVRQKTVPVPAILAKPEEIQQVLFNVIRNGIQACIGQGVVEIETSHQDDRVSVRIRDSGTGVPADNEKKIFDPFFTTKGPDDGDGLGLYIVRQIVTRHGGTVDLVTDGGSGTTFIIEFPAADRK
ncbi:MAG: PAS domain S-box protein [Proteobacteria bacterium]|nr:PAS domain S-box protein [Pseudomonadota bacterium]